MISTAYYPYPVNDKSSARRAARQPYIYSPPELHHSSRNAMYPHLHPSGSPVPTYIYSGYEQYYAKDGWMAAVPESWPPFYPFSPRSSSLHEAVINPKVTIHPPQPILVSDIDTPSSISSHSVLTPSSPFTQQDVGEMDFQPMDFDDLDCDDEEDYIDSDYADEMEGIDEAEGQSPLYSASVPHVIKSTSALEGALGDTPSSSYGTNPGAFTPADRKMSASVPGYPSASHRSTSSVHQRWSEKTQSPAPLTVTSSSPAPEPLYSSPHTYTQRNEASSSSTSLFAPPLYNHTSSSSLAGAFASSIPSSHASRPTTRPLPILQPQPIRPIPPIPLADLAASANESHSSACTRTHASQRLQTLSPLPLLCQPVSDAVRYQLKEPPASASEDDACYDDENTSEPMCEDLVTGAESDRFARGGLAFCPEHASTNGSCAVEGRLYSCGNMNLPIRWH